MTCRPVSCCSRLRYNAVVPLDLIRGAITRNPPEPRRCSRKGWRPWSQKNASVAKKSLRMSICTTAPPAFRKRTWSARNDSSVCCASMSRSPAAMARRVFLSRSTKWRRDDEPLEPQARCPSWIPSRTPRGGSRADSGPQVLPPARATVPPWLPAKSARVSNLLACCALGPPASAAQYSCRREPCTGRSAWLPLGRACLSAWIEHNAAGTP